MKLDKITDCVNKTNSKRQVWTPSFLEGYRAFVFGGKYRTFYYNGNLKKATGGYSPPDYISEEAKAEWNAGIKYARKERKECREL
jgi:hypothetical protein